MEKLSHWTNRSLEDLVHSVAVDFMAQIEMSMEQSGMERKELALKAGVSPGRVSQVLNNPSGLNLRSMVKYAAAMNKKVAVVTYDDNDPQNAFGPISGGVFGDAWRNAGCPRDLFEIHGAATTASWPTGLMTGQSYPTDMTMSKMIAFEETGRGNVPPVQHQLVQKLYERR